MINRNMSQILKRLAAIKAFPKLGFDLLSITLKRKETRNIEKLQLQKRRLRRKRPSKRWKKCNPVRKKKRQL